MNRPWLTSTIVLLACDPVARELITDPRCSTSVEFNPCQFVPEMLQPDMQEVDGIGGEFCILPHLNFEVGAMPVVNHYVDPPSVSSVHGAAHVAWSANYFHAYVHVSDPRINAAADVDLWKGDAVELFIAAPSATGYDGSYSNDDGKTGPVQIVISPPQGRPARASMFLNYTTSEQLVPLREGSSFASRLVTGGYDVELRVPWAGARPSAAGDTVAFDFAIDVQDNPAGADRELQGLLNQTFVDGSQRCGAPADQAAWPACDTRSWCLPVLK